MGLWQSPSKKATPTGMVVYLFGSLHGHTPGAATLGLSVEFLTLPCYFAPKFSYPD
jgi:hypothetical protein